ncbi:MAG TPA: glycosyltransferase family 4 protein [Tepidisphaeraceae bacterium]|jgi:glycosyltransferase involved in cell wall biosynthesis|nr:glycosyltransferase family 4 protein [Tepidisphaeraceae bacterium]
MIVTCLSFYTGQGAWGADHSFVETLQLLRERGIDCRVVFPMAGSMGYDMVRAAGFDVTIVRYTSSVSRGTPIIKRRLRNGFNRLAAVRLAALARGWGSDLIYSNTLSIAVGALAARTAHIPHVWHIREFGQEDHGWTFDFGMPNMVDWIAGSEGVVANSRAVARKFAGLTQRPDIAVVHNAVSLRESDGSAAVAIQPLPADVTFRCTIAGRFMEGKGQIEAVEAIAELRRRGVQAGLWLVGDGDASYRAKIVATIAARQLVNYVRVVGYVPNPLPYLRAADAVLVCSRAEALGRATVEGMLASKPVVATASGGTPELIDDGRTGLLYPPGDVAALADRLAWLAGDATRRATIGRAAAEHARVAFAPQRYGDELVAALKRAVAVTANGS